ncbi:MAG: hypothetical protein P8L20_09135 [Flavobacteriales bacterium]|nr:hypothetical protein [Flavobacteriales bacterium]
MKYTLSAKNPANHFISIQVECSLSNQDKLTIQLPAWRPGRYELANFAKNIKDFVIYDQNGNRLFAPKLNKDSWEVECKGAASITIEYDYYASELNAGSTWMDENQLYVNPVNCCVFVLGKENEPCEIQLEIPNDYKVASSMKPLKNNLFMVADYQELADTPFIASNSLQHNSYESKGITFHVWFQGECKPNWNKLITDFQKFTDYQIEVFNGFPVKEYHFMNQITSYRSYHGVEHQKSTVIQLGPSHKVFGASYLDFLGVSSHELYHTWNIKTIRPKEMLPYDFTKENYSYLGYIAEGVTSYMGDRVLYESGVFEESQYFKEFETYLTRHFHNDGRKHMSVADSSWDTWLDGYVQGIPGRKTSIYTEGALIAYICDMRIRKATNKQASLHEVMQQMYNLCSEGEGYTEADYRNILERISGESFEDIFTKLIYGIEDFTPFIIEALKYEGWIFEAKPSNREYENFGLKGTWKNGSFEISHVLECSTAEKSGILVSDCIHSINGIRINNDFSEWLSYFQEDSISLSLEREKRLKKIDLKPNNGKGFSKFKVFNQNK